DLEPKVRDAEVQAVRRQRFEQEFDALSRIFKNSRNPEARLAALYALAQLEAPEALDLLLETLEHGTPDEAHTATEALAQGTNSAFFEQARKSLPHASPRLRTALDHLMSLRGARH